jgi:hypothetical protein
MRETLLGKALKEL